LPETPSPIRWPRANWRQFTLLVVVNASSERWWGSTHRRPLIAQADFGSSRRPSSFFLVSFGIVKALANLFAGQLADRIGRKPVLVAGWLAGSRCSAHHLGAELGLDRVRKRPARYNQGLCWSTTVIMRSISWGRRGVAGDGLNEFAATSRVAVALLTGYLAAPMSAAGALLSWHSIRHGRTAAIGVCRARHPWPARAEARQRGSSNPPGFAHPAGHELAGPSLFAASQRACQQLTTGCVGTHPRFSRRGGVTLDRIGW